MDTKVKKILITGGAGFMGRWTAKNLLDKGHKIWILDNLSNGFEKNIEEFRDKLQSFTTGDIKDEKALEKLFENNFEIGSHTLSHPMLISLSNEEIEKELKESKELLEKNYKISVNSL